MISLPQRAIPIACVFALCGCAKDVTPSPLPAAPQVAEPQEKYKKPVRMNGRGEITSISFDQFYPLHEAGRTLVYDARHPLFYRLGHIPGAINLPLPDCDSAIHKREEEIKAALASGKTIVVYCTGITCPDARSLARHISGFGYPASIFSGGWDAWKEANLPSEN